jgi:UDP:flavonoid glycosyltransferase YjiC (YdhE family)
MALQRAGHAVRLIAGANFTAWIEAHGLESYPTIDMEALMQSELGVAWTEGANGRAQLQTMKRLLNSMADRTIQDTIRGTEGAELLLAGFVAEPFAQAICERRRIPQITVALQPYRATRSGPASILPLLPRADSVLNRWMGLLAERLTWSVAQETVATLRARLDLPPHSAASYRRAARAVPTLYAMSPHVTPPVDDANVYITGYWFLDEAGSPSPELERFVAAGAPPVYVGFGSMASSDPTRLTQLIVEALTRVGRRAVLVRGWSGAAALDLPASIFPLDGAPHRWLFPRMAALVHHGGAGTTAAGLAAGKPTLIVPHMADQPYWGRRVHELGVGVRPLPRARLTAAALAGRLEELLANPRLSADAARLGQQIRAEDGVARAVEWIDRFIRTA